MWCHRWGKICLAVDFRSISSFHAAWASKRSLIVCRILSDQFTCCVTEAVPVFCPAFCHSVLKANVTLDIKLKHSNLAPRQCHLDVIGVLARSVKCVLPFQVFLPLSMHSIIRYTRQFYIAHATKAANIHFLEVAVLLPWSLTLIKQKRHTHQNRQLALILTLHVRVPSRPSNQIVQRWSIVCDDCVRLLLDFPLNLSQWARHPILLRHRQIPQVKRAFDIVETPFFAKTQSCPQIRRIERSRDFKLNGRTVLRGYITVWKFCKIRKTERQLRCIPAFAILKSGD